MKVLAVIMFHVMESSKISCYIIRTVLNDLKSLEVTERNEDVLVIWKLPTANSNSLFVVERSIR